MVLQMFRQGAGFAKPLNSGTLWTSTPFCGFISCRLDAVVVWLFHTKARWDEAH